MFLFSLLFLALFFGRFLKKETMFLPLTNRNIRFKKSYFVIIILFVIDFVYLKEIPLINAIFNSGTYYKDLDHIPLVYPLITSISVFLIVFYFYYYISFKEKIYLTYILILLIPLVLNIGRGLVVMALLPCLLIYLSQLDFRNSYKKIGRLLLISFVFIILFGQLGNVRSTERIKNENNDLNSIIIVAGQATEEFKNSIVPSEFFWLYLYAASPIANFDNILAKRNFIDYSSLSEFIVYNFMPQSLQKRFLGEFKKNTKYLIIDTFNVSTMFALPYFQYGWWGVFFFLFIYVLFFVIAYIIVRGSNYRVLFLAFFSTSFILGWFSNALVLDVIFIPIAICIFLSILNRKRSKPRVF
tara:strand:- start:319 stop:1386 length:1068 start_codon:yes stop_codon:yes gene_type:complete